MSYSQNRIVYAITKNLPIGIDIEYIQPRFTRDVDTDFIFSISEKAIFLQ